MKRVSVRMLLLSALALVVLGAASASASAYKAFVSPTHNIGCIMEERSVRCDIRDHSWISPPKPRSLAMAAGAFEREYLLKAVRSAPTRTRAAEVLGISRKTLWEKLARHGISLDEILVDEEPSDD